MEYNEIWVEKERKKSTTQMSFTDVIKFNWINYAVQFVRSTWTKLQLLTQGNSKFVTSKAITDFFVRKASINVYILVKVTNYHIMSFK